MPLFAQFLRFRQLLAVTACLTTFSLVWAQEPTPESPLLPNPLAEESAGEEPEGRPERKREGSLMLGPPGSESRSPVRYRALWEPLRPVRGQLAEFGIVTQDAAVTAPVWKLDSGILLMSLGVRHDAVGGEVVLPDSGRPLPEELWNLRLGLNYIHSFQSGWKGGAIVNVGSASDRPFQTLNDVNVGLIGFLRIPRGDANAWNLALIYSPLSEIPFPIPGIAYSWQASERFSANLGIPFSLTWRPNDDWTFDASYMVLHTVHAQATRRLAGRWKAYAAYDWTNSSWLLSQRSERLERLFLYEQRLTVGAVREVGEHVLLDFSVGYAFDRFLFTGRRYSDSHHDRVDISDGPLFGFQAGMRW